MGKSTIQFFKICRQLVVQFQDQRESDFLFQSVLGYSQKERVHHFAVIPRIDADISSIICLLTAFTFIFSDLFNDSLKFVIQHFQ